MPVCKILHAAHWKSKHQSGNTWYVTAIPPASCGLAERWGATLTHLKAIPQGGTSAGNYAKSPSGYECVGPSVAITSLGQEILCQQNEGHGSFTINITASS